MENKRNFRNTEVLNDIFNSIKDVANDKIHTPSIDYSMFSHLGKPKNKPKKDKKWNITSHQN